MQSVSSRYTIFHALVATGILLVVVFYKGFATFWQQFVHGLPQTMTPKFALLSMLTMGALVGTTLLALFGSTYLPFARPTRTPTVSSPPPDRPKALLLTLKIAIPVILVALGLNLLGSHAIEWFSGVRPADQDLIKSFTDPASSPTLRGLLIVAVLFQAPLLEEPLFRGIIFRGFASRMPVWAALALSGFIFAFIHVNAASFVALWFLGGSFAWLYARTRTILAPILLHLLFNGTNLVLLFLFPEFPS